MLNVGDNFGDYKVVSLLGKGGMASVFLLEGASGNKVAAKILDDTKDVAHEDKIRFVREANLAKSIVHKNLIEVYDVGEDPDTGLCYILMEYVDGGSLEDRIAKSKGPFSPIEAARIVRQVADVLEVARRKGVVHRDIKPGNVMFNSEGEVKLADMGIARDLKNSDKSLTVTNASTMIGTPAYMAPEQVIDSHNVDIRADIYALGIMFYEMLAGKRPTSGLDLMEIIRRAIAGEGVEDILKVKSDIPAPLAKLVMRMCEVDRKKRISTPIEIAIELKHFLSDPTTTIERDFPIKIRRFNKTHLIVGAAIVSVLGVILVVFACLMIGGKDSEAPAMPVPEIVEPLKPVVEESSIEEETHAEPEPAEPVEPAPAETVVPVEESAPAEVVVSAEETVSEEVTPNEVAPEEPATIDVAIGPLVINSSKIDYLNGFYIEKRLKDTFAGEPKPAMFRLAKAAEVNFLRRFGENERADKLLKTLKERAVRYKAMRGDANWVAEYELAEKVDSLYKKGVDVLDNYFENRREYFEHHYSMNMKNFEKLLEYSIDNELIAIETVQMVSILVNRDYRGGSSHFEQIKANLDGGSTLKVKGSYAPLMIGVVGYSEDERRIRVSEDNSHWIDLGRVNPVKLDDLRIHCAHAYRTLRGLMKSAKAKKRELDFGISELEVGHAYEVFYSATDAALIYVEKIYTKETITPRKK